MPEVMLVAAKALSKPLGDLYDFGKSEVKKKLARWKASKNVNELYRRISSVQKVKTIWQVEREVNLKKFYYPSRITFEDEKEPEIVNAVSKFPTDSTRFIIQGTVGQGKSIFLRYLCSQELRLGDRIPVFYELRKIQKGETLIQHVYGALKSLGFAIDDDLFDYFANSDKFILMLDGFDELDPDIVPTIIRELEGLCERYDRLRIIVTSRPDSGVQQSAYFRVYKLAALTSKDHPHILQKLVGEQKKVAEILRALNASSSGIGTLLSTPLMVTLLVIQYKAEQKIPEAFSEFYENLFVTLLSRHDKTKPGYVRKRKTSLNEKQLQQVFEAFCFFSRQQKLSMMKTSEVSSLAERAIGFSQAGCGTTDFISDVSKVTCLLLEEGYKYYFIHKSVQEYYAASFLRYRPEGVSVSFYEKVQGKWQEWRQELIFLEQIDRYRYAKYFSIPQTLAALEKLGVNPDSGEMESGTVDDILNEYECRYNKAKHEFLFTLARDRHSMIEYDFLFRAFSAMARGIPGLRAAAQDAILKEYAQAAGEFFVVPFFSAVKHTAVLERVRATMLDSLAKLIGRYRDDVAYVKNEDQAKALLIAV